MVALSFRFPHHGKYASYHRLLDYLEPQDRAVDASLPLAIYHNRYLNRRDMASRGWRWFKEAEAWRIAKATGSTWVHYLYPEHGYFRGARQRQLNQKILFSCHLPEWNVEQIKDRLKLFVDGLRQADGIILMSPNDEDYYARMAPQAKVSFIPHGVDLHYFSPDPGKEKAASGPFRLLTVGNMLRDFPRLAAVLRHAVQRKPDLEMEFHVVANTASLAELRKLAGEEAWRLVKPHHGISDEALRDLYRSSDLLFLPLISATANNALLESMAVGLPVFVSDLSACRAYAKDCAFYFSDDLDAADIHAALGNLLADRGRLGEVAGKARRLAEEELGWEVIVKRHKRFMESIS